VKVSANTILLDVEAGISDELPPLVMQSFKEGHYPLSIGMEVDE
jgi:hypothetical protein